MINQLLPIEKALLLPPRRPRHPLPIVAKGLGSIENEARTVVSINFEMALNLLGMPQVIGIEEEEDVPFGPFGGPISRDRAISFCEVKDHRAVLAGNLTGVIRAPIISDDDFLGPK